MGFQFLHPLVLFVSFVFYQSDRFLFEQFFIFISLILEVFINPVSIFIFPVFILSVVLFMKMYFGFYLISENVGVSLV